MPNTGKVRSLSLTSQESYSAVIIADLIAEVQQQPESDKKKLTQVSEECSVDDSKATDNPVDDHQTDDKSNYKNGTNICKGVILNAVQFGHPDSISKTSNDIPLQDGNESKTEPMSGSRKIAFGFSFLPSILFVVCFAVIFPCQKVLPCTKEAWSITLNHTVVTSRLQVAETIFFAYSTEDEYGLRGVKENSGQSVWDTPTAYPSLYTQYGNLAQPNKLSCLVMDIKGNLSLFDQLNGIKLWQLDSEESKTPPFPVILPDCDNDGFDEIAVAVSSSKIKLIFKGSETYISFRHCESIPTNIFIWKNNARTDLVLSCRKGENEILLKIPQNIWCKNYNKNLEQMSILSLTKTSLLSQSKLLSTLEGLIFWSEDTVTMFDIYGRMKWTVSDLNHTQQNRFLLHGKSNKDEPQVILYSNDILNNLQVTMLNFGSGNITLSKIIPNSEISETALLHGEKNDFVLSLRKKLTKENNMLPNEGTTFVEELILMELNGKYIKTVYTFNNLEGQYYSTLFTALVRENKDLDVYVLRRLRDKNYTVLKKISTSQWDTFSKDCNNK